MRITQITTAQAFRDVRRMSMAFSTNEHYICLVMREAYLELLLAAGRSLTLSLARHCVKSSLRSLSAASDSFLADCNLPASRAAATASGLRPSIPNMEHE